MSDSLEPHRLYSPRDSPGQNTGVGSRSLFQGIFPTQGLNPGLLHYRQILYLLSQSKALKTYHFSSVGQLCPTLCNPVNRSTPGLPVHHQLLEFTQTHVHRVSDAIQPTHPLSSPSPPEHQSLPESGYFPMSQLFTSGGQSTGVSALASVLPMNTQD